MNISNEYKIKSSCYVGIKTKKNQIVIGDTYNYDMNHVKSTWRNGGAYEKCPHFSIDRMGNIYQHFNIDYSSLYLNCSTDEKVITIALSNIGYLLKHGDFFYDIYNNTYAGDVVKKQWKNCQYWQPYTNEQLEASIKLCRYLLNETNIPNKVIEINVTKNDITSFEGICYRSNHHIKHYDINPTWDFKKFKNTIEIDNG